MNHRRLIHLAQAQGIELGSCGLRIKSVDLVGNYCALLPRATYVIGNLIVSGHDPRTRIHHIENEIAFVYGLQGLSGHTLGQFLGLINVILGNTAGIDEHVFAPLIQSTSVLTIAGKARKVRNQRITRFGKAIEKSGFAYVGATYQSYNFHMMIPGKNAKFRKSTQRIYGDGIITQKSCLREKAAI